jgi:hypothetical protein
LDEIYVSSVILKMVGVDLCNLLELLIGSGFLLLWSISSVLILLDTLPLPLDF